MVVDRIVVEVGTVAVLFAMVWKIQRPKDTEL